MISPYVIPALKTPEEIAAETWNITTDQLYQRTRKREVVEARSTLIYYRNQKLKLKQAISAGKYGLNHSSTDHIVKQIKIWLEVDKQFRSKFELFKSKVS
jgi:chromosomal replication initiation ATPase DnaA